MPNQRTIAEEVAWSVRRSGETQEVLRAKFGSSWAGFLRFVSRDYQRRSEVKLRDLAAALDAELTLALEPERLDFSSLKFDHLEDAPRWLQACLRFELETVLKFVAPPQRFELKRPFVGWYLGQHPLTYHGDAEPTRVDAYYVLAWDQPLDVEDPPANGVLHDDGYLFSFDVERHRGFALEQPSAAGQAFLAWEPPYGYTHFYGPRARLLGYRGQPTVYVVDAKHYPLAELKTYIDYLEKVVWNQTPNKVAPWEGP